MTPTSEQDHNDQGQQGYCAPMLYPAGDVRRVTRGGNSGHTEAHATHRS
jgi:hypothetical protein